MWQKLSDGRMRIELKKVGNFVYECWTTETSDSVIARPSRQMLDGAVVSSDGAASMVNCRFSIWSSVFSMALNLFSRLVVPRIPTCSCGPSGSIASNHQVHDGPSGSLGHSSSGSGILPNTRWISPCWNDETVNHHLLPFDLTCNIQNNRHSSFTVSRLYNLFAIIISLVGQDDEIHKNGQR